MMWGYGWNGGYGEPASWAGMILMMGFMVLIFIGGCLLVMWLVRGVAPFGGGCGGGYPLTPPRNEAGEIARQRYARGEITKEEYEEIRRTLGG